MMIILSSTRSSAESILPATMECYQHSSGSSGRRSTATNLFVFASVAILLTDGNGSAREPKSIRVRRLSIFIPSIAPSPGSGSQDTAKRPSDDARRRNERKQAQMRNGGNHFSLAARHLIARTHSFVRTSIKNASDYFKCLLRLDHSIYSYRCSSAGGAGHRSLNDETKHTVIIRRLNDGHSKKFNIAHDLRC